MKKSKIQKIIEYIPVMFVIFIICGIIYFSLEMIFRGRSDWTMFVCAGLIGVLASALNNIFTYEMLFQEQIFIGTVIATLLEGIIGEIIKFFNNGINPVWDYSQIKNDFIRSACFFDGQCNFFFSLIWAGLIVVAILVGDSIDYYVFKNEPQPYYKISEDKVLFRLPKFKNNF